MSDPIVRLAADLDDLRRRLRALETAPRAAFTDEILDQQQDIINAQQDITAAQSRLAETSKVLVFSPGSTTDSSLTAGWQDWLTLGSMSVPAWASGCYVVCSVSPVTHNGAAGIVQVRALLGSNVFAPVAYSATIEETDIEAVVWGAAVTGGLSGSGSQTVKLQTQQVFDAQLRAETTTVVGFLATFF